MNMTDLCPFMLIIFLCFWVDLLIFQEQQKWPGDISFFPGFAFFNFGSQEQRSILKVLEAGVIPNVIYP